MQTRHLNELLGRLERVIDIGCCEIRSNELLSWYDQERLTTGIWRDIQDKWEMLLEENGSESELFVGEGDAQYVFIWGRNLVSKRDSSDSENESWFQNVVDMAKRKPLTEIA